MAEAELTSLRVRVSPGLYQKIEAMIEGRGVTVQRALESLLSWVVDEDPLTQAMIFNQVPPADRAELSRIVLRRLGGLPLDGAQPENRTHRDVITRAERKAGKTSPGRRGGKG